MKATVDPDLCTACELCVDTCPDVFEMDDDLAKVIVDIIPADSEDCAREAAEDCPAEAITIEEQKDIHQLKIIKKTKSSGKDTNLQREK